MLVLAADLDRRLVVDPLKRLAADPLDAIRRRDLQDGQLAALLDAARLERLALFRGDSRHAGEVVVAKALRLAVDDPVADVAVVDRVRVRGGDRELRFAG